MELTLFATNVLSQCGDLIPGAIVDQSTNVLLESILSS